MKLDNIFGLNFNGNRAVYDTKNQYINDGYKNINLNKFFGNPISFRGNLYEDCFEKLSDPQYKALIDKCTIETHSRPRTTPWINCAKNELLEAQEKLSLIQKNTDSCLEMCNDEKYQKTIKEICTRYENKINGLDDEIKTTKALYDRLNKYRTLGYRYLNDDNFQGLKDIIAEFEPEYIDIFNSKEISETELFETANRFSELFDSNCQRLIEKKEDLKNKKLNEIENASRQYCLDNSLELDSDVVANLNLAVAKSNGVFDDNLKKDIRHPLDEQKNLVSRKENYLKDEIKSFEERFKEYEKVLKEKPYLAPLYNPLNSRLEIEEYVTKNTRDFVEIDQRCYPQGFIKGLDTSDCLKPAYKLEYGARRGRRYYDLNNSETKDILQKVINGKDKIYSSLNFSRTYYIPFNEILSYPVDIISFDERTARGVVRREYINMSDENTEKIVNELSEKYSRTIPILSKYAYTIGYQTGEYSEIPAKKLQDMGFGNVTYLRKLVQGGKLKGRIEEIETENGTKYRTFVDLEDGKTPKILEKIRDKTPVSELSELARELGISKKRLLEHIKENELDIIKESMFPYECDPRKIYIDRRIPKNKEFIEKALFEKEFKEEQIAVTRQKKIERKNAQGMLQSLRMKLVWHFCPNTRKIASKMAKDDGYLCQLLIKEDSDEELTKREQIKVNSYRKEMWLHAGSEELKEGFKKADEVIALYSKGGIEAIEDDEIREILTAYECE